MNNPTPNLRTLLAGAALAYLGFVGAGFFGLLVLIDVTDEHPMAALVVLLVFPLPLCVGAAIGMAGLFYAICHDRAIEARRLGLHWVKGCAGGFLLWWVLYIALWVISFDIDESMGFVAMSAVLLAGALLMFLSMPPRGGT